MGDNFSGHSIVNNDLAPCYMFSFDHDGIMTGMNKTILNDLGYEPHELPERSKFSEILTVGSKIFFQTHFYPLIRMKGSFNELFLSLKTKGGDEIPVLMNVVMRGDSERHEIYCAGIRISQRNRYEKELLEAKKVAENALLENEILVALREELESHQELMEKKLQRLTQRNREQKELSTVISHDLQEPLRKIMTFANMLLDNDVVGTSPELQQRVGKIMISAERMRYLVLSMQKYLTLNEKTFLPQKINTNLIFEKVKDDLISVNPHNISLDVSVLPELFADGHMVSTLFSELLSNSIKFADPSKPQLHVSLQGDVLEQNMFVEIGERYKYAEYVRLKYVDNGKGFDSRFSEEVFNLFRKADLHSDGLGFGLAYCKKVVDLHHGQITASSSPGKGTEFTILLPRSAERKPAAEKNVENAGL